MKNFNLYTSRAKYALSSGLSRFILMALAIVLFSGANVYGQGNKPAASLEQIRNGSATKVVDPAQWQNGNAGNQTAHYLESHSIGYRALLSNLPQGEVTVTLGYDIRHSSKNAIDFLTHYDRLQPHQQFGHTQEEVDPTIGTGFTEGVGAKVYEIPRPNSTGLNDVPSDVPGKVWDALSEAERKMTMWGGEITDIQYVQPYASLTAASSEQRITVTFIADGGPAVLAWGGHIANRFDWGFDQNGVPLSAGGISGSPYHMRLIGWTLGNLGQQDRSLSASAVWPLVGCNITGASPVCGATTNTYTATSAAPGATFVWSITAGNGTIVANSQTTTPTMSGGTQSTIDVLAGASGSFTLKVDITATGYLPESCTKTVTINAVPAEPDDEYIAPACDETTFSVKINSPLANATYTLKDKCGNTIPNVTGTINTGATPGAFITFTGIPAGTGYSITVTKDGCTSTAAQCGSTANCPTNGTSSVQSQSSSSLKVVEPAAAEDDVVAYPVPFRGKATVEFKLANTERYEINLYDMRGNLVKQLKSGKAKAGELQQVEIDGTNLEEGMYLVRVVSGRNAKTVKLLKKE